MSQRWFPLRLAECLLARQDHLSGLPAVLLSALWADSQRAYWNALQFLDVPTDIMFQVVLWQLRNKLTEIEETAVRPLSSAASNIQAPDLKRQKSLPIADSIAKDTISILKNVQAAQDSRKASLAQLNASLISFARK